MHAHSALHRIAPQCKVAAVLLFVFAVVSTPRGTIWAYCIYGVVLIALVRFARVPLPTVGRRLVIELPFVAFALLLPLVARGPRIEVAGVLLSQEGLWAAWNIGAKATLGAAATILLTATTPTIEILRGLERLRVPGVVVAIANFMVRYLEVIAGEMRRMKIARESRGFEGRWWWQARAVAAGAGTLFIRSYERGERVYLAMISRGYAGSLPGTKQQIASRTDWTAALAVPLFAALVSAGAWVAA